MGESERDGDDASRLQFFGSLLSNSSLIGKWFGLIVK